MYFLKHNLFVFTLQLELLLKNFTQPVRIEITTFEPADEPDKTEVLFVSFDASKTEDVPLSMSDQLEYIHSLDNINITVIDGAIHWEGTWW